MPSWTVRDVEPTGLQGYSVVEIQKSIVTDLLTSNDEHLFGLSQYIHTAKQESSWSNSYNKIYLKQLI